jgi:hypothetical protein
MPPTHATATATLQVNWTIVAGIVYTATTLVYNAPNLFGLSAVLFTALALTFSILAHRWAHMSPKDCPAVATLFQNLGIFVSKEVSNEANPLGVVN